MLESIAAVVAFFPAPPALPGSDLLFQPFVVIADGCDVGATFQSECRIAATKCRVSAAICGVLAIAGAIVTVGVSVVTLGAVAALLAASATILDDLADGHSPDSDTIAGIVTAGGAIAGIDLGWLADFVKSPLGRRAVGDAAQQIGSMAHHKNTKTKAKTALEAEIFVAGSVAFLSGVLDRTMTPDQVTQHSRALVDGMRRQAGLGHFTFTKFYQASEHWKAQGARRTAQAAVDAMGYKFASESWFPAWAASAVQHTGPGPNFGPAPDMPGFTIAPLPTPTSGGSSGGGGGGFLLAAAAAAALALATG